MWVAVPWRGRGVGDLLVRAVIGWANDDGATRIGLWVPADNDRACNFYQRKGFRATGRRASYPGDRGRFICEMTLAIRRIR